MIDTATATVSAIIGVRQGALGGGDPRRQAHLRQQPERQHGVSAHDLDRAGTVSGPIVVGPKPSGIVIAPDGRYAYVANNGRGVLAGQDVEVGNTVSVIDTAKGVVSDTITVGNAPVGLAVTPDGKHIYVANVDE